MPGTSVALDTVETLSKFLSNKFSLSQAWRLTKNVFGLGFVQFYAANFILFIFFYPQ